MNQPTLSLSGCFFGGLSQVEVSDNLAAIRGTMPRPQRIRVTVCACTYRRPEGLAALLEGLGEQAFARLPRPALGIIIADNEGSDRVRQLCHQFTRASDLPVDYVHEPRRGISQARNACLDRIRDDCDFFALIDDDEIPHPDWLEQLLLAQQHTDADVVQGKEVPVLPDGAPDWLVEGGYFSWHDVDSKACVLRNGYRELDYARSSNALVRYATVRELDLRFDERFALTGAEDITFFQAIKAAGHRIVYAQHACVRHIIPPDRTTLSYLLRMWYRVGCNERFKRRSSGKPNFRLKRILRRGVRASGCPAILSGAAHVITNVVSGRTSMKHLARGIRLVAHGFGQAASLAGIRYEHYR
jgi:succinoglycan biosynthesis protein ExoM